MAPVLDVVGEVLRPNGPDGCFEGPTLMASMFIGLDGCFSTGLSGLCVLDIGLLDESLRNEFEVD